MIPRTSRLGSSFKSCGLYYLHDKDASTSERVEFTHTENIPTQDPQKALKWMAFTAIHSDELKRENGSPGSGQRCHKPVFTLSLSWHPEQNPNKWEMIGAGRRALIALGLADHETLMVSHNETEHPHLHLIVNTVHPETGVVNNLSFSRLKLSRWAEEYEREHGKIYCDKRVENNEKREQGEYVQYEEPQPEVDHKARIAGLYHASDSGKAFQQALAQAGYKLAQGKRIVVIDKDGNLYSLSRQVEGVNAKDIRAKLSDLVLPTIDEAGGKSSTEKDAAQSQPKPDETKKVAKQDRKPEGGNPDEPEYMDRDQQDRDWQESIIDAGIAAPEKPKKKAPDEKWAEYEAPPALLNRLQVKHLSELGRFYESTSQARQRLAVRMQAQYGEHERTLRRDLSHLEQTLANSGRVRTWWLKLTRQIPKNAEEEAQNMQRSLANIQWRQQEAQQALERRTARERYAIDARQEKEHRELQPRPAQENSAPASAVKEDYDDGPWPEVAMDDGPAHDEDSGPSLSF